MMSEVKAQGTGQICQAVSEVLACSPRQTTEGMRWDVQTKPGIQSALLRPGVGQRHELDLVLAEVPEAAVLSLRSVWDLMAKLVNETDLTAVPIACSTPGAGGRWQITARLTLRDSALDLPRLNRLSGALELLNRSAMALQAELPSASLGFPAKIPVELNELFRPVIAHLRQDSQIGSVCSRIIPLLQSGLSVALVGNPLRVQLELSRIAGLAATHLALLLHPTPIQRLPQLARLLKQAGFILASPCSLLRPRVSVYEQGREVEAAFRELSASALPVLTFGKREELESVFGVGQGRSHSPFLPVVQTLLPAEDRDLVQVALAESCCGLAAAKVDQLIDCILNAAAAGASENEELLQPLSTLAAGQGPDNPGLPAALADLARDLTSRRDTFGTCAEAPAEPRQAEVNRHLIQRLGESNFEQGMQSRILGQDAALRELAGRLFREAISRSHTEPLRLLVAGPVGTGKSMVARFIAQALEWPFHYIDAASFDSPHSVMTSLAGVSPGIVSAYNDGVLAKISRRPAVVEVADIDHALPGVRGALCEFFLRILQEGTLQTGSGAIIRTLPSVIFIFTSNVAHGIRKTGSGVGFGGQPTREVVRQEVVSCTVEYLGHAFASRVGAPVLFEEFTPETAVRVAEMEIQSLVRRVTGADTVELWGNVGEWIIASMATLDTGARGIIDATRDALAIALRDRVDMRAERVLVGLEGQRVIVEVASEQPLTQPVESEVAHTEV